MLRFALLLCCCGVVLTAAEDSPKIKKYVQDGGELGRYWTVDAPGPLADPVAAPDPSAFGELGKRIKSEQIDGWVAALVDRIEAHYRDKADASAVAWLEQHPDIRKAFWLSLDWTYDEIPAATAVLAKLIAHDEQRVINFYHLAIAMAVVFDSDDALYSSRICNLWAVVPSQMPPLPEMLEIFDYFTSEENQSRFVYPPDKLVWPLLVHLVDCDLPESERDWVHQKFPRKEADYGYTYKMVPYDYDKLNRTPKLGTKPYVLANLLQYGGVCVDQAHFSSRVMKTLGVPAIKVSGDGRYGGAGHAWTGYLSVNGRNASFGFTGRYNFDYFYTGDVFDPKTRTETLDRAMAMDLDAALLDYGAFVDAGALTRIAHSIMRADPALSLRLTELALERNYYVADAWRLLIDHLVAGTLDAKAGKKWLGTMVKQLEGHPDITWPCLSRALDPICGDSQKDRQKLYELLAPLYAKRPDLQIALRRAQMGELFAAGAADAAINCAAQTLLANADQGTEILPLVEAVVEDGRARPEPQREVIRKMLEQVDRDFPKKRGNSPSEAYAEFRKLVDSL